LWGEHDSGQPKAYCTAAFGARDKIKEERGQPIYAYFSLTAAHCFFKGSVVYRKAYKESPSKIPFGYVKRFGLGNSGEWGVTDAEGIALNDDKYRSHGIYFGDPRGLLPVLGTEAPKINMHVCWSGTSSGVDCSKIIGL